MTDTLPGLLERLRSGSASAAERATARALVEGDVRLPEDVRRDAFVDEADTVADATALLGLFGAPLLGSGPSFASLLREAADVEVAVAVAGELGMPILSVAEAVTAEAGQVDVAGDVFAALGLAQVEVADAVRAEAGHVDVADGVFAALGLDRLAVADAVHAEAGEIDIAGRVFAELGLNARPKTVEPAAPMPLSVNDPFVRRPGALRAGPPSRGFGSFGRRASWGAVALAAAALLAVVVGRPWAPENVPAEHLQFAQASDVVIEDLEYAEGVQVVQLEGAEGAAILWVDDGEV